ncbi:helix-hairpin-helix domain-containing protein [Rhodovibrio salinarum]|uniref:Helix-hairpin-helix domain-containing protein n=1 Tax=Rhodovibrio salinarum TaxID=1087 RepID=A0A934QF91_9PROT|nr:helix-hairpin-helix domain-containing protein [Rhodovibrio salinarum]MBK1695946.1 helix-hairpin-helix domain-containing protein [Rhodovibrio salinarum]
MLTKIVEGLDSVFRAWRYHLAVPTSRDELRKLIRTGPEPVNSDVVNSGSKGHNGPPKGLDGFDPFTLLSSYWEVEYDKQPQKPYHALVDLLDIPEIDKKAAWSLYEHGIISVDDVRRADMNALARLSNVGEQTVAFLKTL